MLTELMADIHTGQCEFSAKILIFFQLAKELLCKNIKGNKLLQENMKKKSQQIETFTAFLTIT